MACLNVMILFCKIIYIYRHDKQIFTMKFDTVCDSGF